MLLVQLSVLLLVSSALTSLVVIAKPLRARLDLLYTSFTSASRAPAKSACS
jgi:hypothetical protein